MSDLPKFKDWYRDKYHTPYPGHVHEPAANVLQRLTDAMAEWCDLIADSALERATGYAVGDPENRDD